MSALFGEVVSRVGERPGGYTRIIRLGEKRVGDKAEMCMIELVDFNDLYTKEATEKKSGRTRRGRGKKSTETVATEKEVKAEAAAPEAAAPKEAPETSKKEDSDASQTDEKEEGK